MGWLVLIVKNNSNSKWKLRIYELFVAPPIIIYFFQDLYKEIIFTIHFILLQLSVDQPNELTQFHQTRRFYKPFVAWILFSVDFLRYLQRQAFIVCRLIGAALTGIFSMIPSYLKIEIFGKGCTWTTLGSKGLSPKINISLITLLDKFILRY